MSPDTKVGLILVSWVGAVGLSGFFTLAVLNKAFGDGPLFQGKPNMIISENKKAKIDARLKCD